METLNDSAKLMKHNQFKPSLAENSLTLARGNDEMMAAFTLSIDGKQLVFSIEVFSS